jgi:hypothetical protein
MKWLASLVFVTAVFIGAAFFVDEQNLRGYLWMTMGMAVVSFLYYLMVISGSKKESKLLIGSNIAAVIVKFMLSALVIILYAFIFGLHRNIEFAYFFMAYLIYSIVMYTGAYFNR